MNDKKKFWQGALCGGLVAGVLVGLIACVLFLLYALGGNRLLNGASDGVVKASTESKLGMLEELIDEVFLYSDEIEEEELQEEIIKGYIEGLNDPYSVYYDEEETTALYESTSGEFSGIGVVISQDTTSNRITFHAVYEGAPAEEAGFQAGDILYKVDGEDITSQEMSEVVKLIKGEEGTTVEITVLRGETLQEVTALTTRRKIEVVTVDYLMTDTGIGYIQISEFDDVTYEQFKEALEHLEKQGVKGLVFDVRNNPGGGLQTVCNMLDLLLPEGTIVYTETKNGERKTFTSDEEHKLELPMVVLVNENSASASEIFAGALQDYDAAEIVGMTTYGKGIVQQLFPMTDGTCVKLTISEYFTPNGKNIHGKGITPDVEVPYEVSEEEPDVDNQLKKAIEVLMEQLDN